MAIRYDKKLQKEIYRTVANFNQKIKRLEKQGNELLPDKVTISELKNTSTSRRELRTKLNKLKRFSRRHAEDVINVGQGVPMTKYDANELLIEYRTASRRLNANIKRISVTAPKVFGVLQDATFKEMGSDIYTSLVAKRQVLKEMNLKLLDSSNINRFRKLLNRINTPYISQTFKNNYIDMLTGTAYYYGYDEEKIKDIEDKLMKLDDTNFTRLFEEESAIKAVLDYYLTMKMSEGVKPEYYKDDVSILYDELYNNIDEILEDYK